MKTFVIADPHFDHENIIKYCNRGYSFSEDKTLVRANQGHSIPVDLELRPDKTTAVCPDCGAIMED